MKELDFLDESTIQYVRTHSERIKFTIGYAKEHNLINNNVMNVGSLDEEALLAWETIFPEASIICTDGSLNKPLPYKNNSFDSIIFTEVFEHIGGDIDFLSSHNNYTGILQLLIEIMRVMKPNGKCLLTTPNICSFKNISLALYGTHSFMYPLHYREYTEYEIKTLLKFVDSEIISFESHNVFYQDNHLAELLKLFCDEHSLPLVHRGNDFFIVLTKPEGWKAVELPENTAFILYPDCKREDFKQRRVALVK